MPLEAPALILVLLLISFTLKRWLSGLLVLVLGVLLLLRLADIGSYLAFNRRFNPLVELHLISDGWNLASTSTGPLQASIIAAVTLLLLLVAAYFLYRSFLIIANTPAPWRKFTLWLAAIALAAGGTALMTNQKFDYGVIVSANVVPEIRQRINRIIFSVRDQKIFLNDLQKDSVLDVRQPTFSALKDKDIIVLFIESYGRGYLDAERFKEQSHTLLSSVEQTISDAGLGSRSGWLTSPIRGGRSWLAHASFQAGLEIDNQARFDRLITTPRQSLTRLFGQAGWTTIGVMPAIQYDWPEGTWYGFDQLYVSQELGFAGDRFGYVTMPDQYTLSHFERVIRAPMQTPVMATIALLSTHAPWTPLPRKLDWNAIGDGSIYDGSHRFGEKISWKYRSKVQEQFVQSFDYTMDVVAEYAARYADDAVIIVLGDHQPAPIINGWGKSGDVPIHIISNDEELLRRLPEGSWTQGMIPGEDIKSEPMWGFRKMMSSLFESY